MPDDRLDRHRLRPHQSQDLESLELGDCDEASYIFQFFTQDKLHFQHIELVTEESKLAPKYSSQRSGLTTSRMNHSHACRHTAR